MTTATDDIFMRRCLQLATLGEGLVSPNPMVGALLVHEGKVIGEGWHQGYGLAHAEVNAVASVAIENRTKISESTLYCNLEPCFHFGKTPPCVQLVFREGIKKVVIAHTDPNPLVGGKSVTAMREAGLEVIVGVLQKEAEQLNAAFLWHIRHQKPYIILKWAVSSNGYMGVHGNKIPITTASTQRLAHRWRYAADAILVGAKTALTDNPMLDTRYYRPKSLLRIILSAGKQPPLPSTHHVMQSDQPTWIIGSPTPIQSTENIRFLSLSPTEDAVTLLFRNLKEAKKNILFVEGGAEVLKYFIANHLWNEIRVLTGGNTVVNHPEAIPAPQPPTGALLHETYQMGYDMVQIYLNHKTY